MSETEIHISQIVPGSANQLIGANSAATKNEYKTLSGTTSQVIVTNSVGTYTLSTPQNIATTSTPTFASETLTATTNQLILGTTNTVTISSTAPSASRTYTIPDAGATANMVLDHGAYTIAGAWTFSNNINTAGIGVTGILSINTGNFLDLYNTAGTALVGITGASVTTSYNLSMPVVQGAASTFLQNNGSGTLSWAQGGGVGFREDYIVGTALNNYTGSTTVFNLVNSYNVGGHTLIVTYDGVTMTPGSSADYVETNSTTVTFNNALVTGQRVSFIFSQAPSSTSGIVNSGTQYQLGYYAAGGTTISGNTGLITDSGNNLYTGGGFVNIGGNNTGAPVVSFSRSDISWKITNETNLRFYETASFSTNPSTSKIFELSSGGTLGIFTNSGAAGGILGTTTNDNAVAGNVGEAVRAYASAVALGTSAQFTNITSISLTAGDWDVSGVGELNAGATGVTVNTLSILNLSAFSGNTTTDAVEGDNYLRFTPVLNNAIGTSIPVWRVTLSTTTTIYLKMNVTYTSSTGSTMLGRISARRVR